VGEAVSDGVLAIVAGADTTSSALSRYRTNLCLLIFLLMSYWTEISSFLWCVLSNPDIYRRVQAEVDTVYPDEESVSDTSKHADLHLLTACLYVEPIEPSLSYRRALF
jgi:cytochrome P450